MTRGPRTGRIGMERKRVITMKAPRLLLVGLTVASVVSLSSAALASPQAGVSTGARLAQARHATGTHPTGIRFLDFDHMLASGGTMHVRGQVIGKLHGDKGALAGVQVKLYRQFNGTSPWVYLGSQPTGGGDFPQFDFATLARMNARYKVVFAGNDTFRGSSDITWLSVYRTFNAHITDGEGAATLSGNINPYYNHKVVYLQKRSCATCDYVSVKKATTAMAGAYKFALNAPDTGRWWWRVWTPGTGAFIPSWSGTFTTELS